MDKNIKMNAKKTLVSFLLVASVLFLATAVSAAPTIDYITIDDVDYNSTTVTAGDIVSVEVTFTADARARDVVVKVELGDAEVEKELHYIVEENGTYTETLTLQVPFDFKENEVDDDLKFKVTVEGEETVSGDDFEVSESGIVTVFKKSYNLAIKSVMTDGSVDAGETLPVEFVLKNVGYNDADDIYITVSIPELNIQKSTYLGELNAVDRRHDENTVSGKMDIAVPYAAEAGVYTVVITAENGKTKAQGSAEVTVENNGVAVRSGNSLILLNPTDKPVSYKVAYNSKEVMVPVNAGETAVASIEVPAGDYSFDVMVYSGAVLLSTVNFAGNAQTVEMQLTNPVFVLTVILAVVFLVLLVVLVVLITKKPQKTEEFGESYY